METIKNRAHTYLNSLHKISSFDWEYIRDGYIQGATDQQAIFDNLPKVKAWITKDKNGRIFIHNDEPLKMSRVWAYSGYFMEVTDDQLPEGCNPQWEDEEPIEVELTINLKKG